MTVTELLVLSASRRTDLVGCYPEILIDRLKKYPPDQVHTVVLWTKNPENLFRGKPLNSILSSYRQLYVHLTITGMGGGDFEPNIPSWKEIVAMLGPLVELTKTPERIAWRFDPILEAERDGEKFSNRALFPVLAGEIASWGIKRCRLSWVSPYRKVVTRMGQRGWRLIHQTEDEKKAQADEFEAVADRLGIALDFCSVAGFPNSRCIDGNMLNRVHPDGLRCSQERAKGQRELCGCTKSLDIGWYTDRCRHGCLYCYALP
jgi:hypothetical protein